MRPASARALLICLAAGLMYSPARGSSAATAMPVAGPVVEAPSAPARETFDIVLEPLPDVVRAGDLVILRWSEGVSDLEEMEILLSVDGGRRFNLRVSPQLDPRACTYRWRVPALDAAEARLAVRVGNERGEFLCRPGPAFRIVADGDSRPEPVLVHEAGWWPGLDGSRPSGGRTLASRPPELTDVGDGLPASGTVRPPRSDGAPDQRPDARECSSPILARSSRHPDRGGSRPRVVPLRN